MKFCYLRDFITDETIAMISYERMFTNRIVDGNNVLICTHFYIGEEVIASVDNSTVRMEFVPCSK